MEEFIPPPEAPVFQPTAEEFKDPVAYITKIRPVVVNTGICKIRPPPGWKPPFACDVDKFKFTPRLQPLNELEAKTRVKLNFLENLAKFWELQGIVFKIPNVDRHPLDLHGLFKVVTKMGGYHEVCRLRKWATVAKELSYYNMTVASSLKVNFEKYLYPYEIFLVKNDKLQEFNQEEDNSPVKDTDQSTVPTCKYGLRQKRKARFRTEDFDEAMDLDKTNPEFRKLAFTAPGPKNSFAPLQCEDSRVVSKKIEIHAEIPAPPSEIKTEGIASCSLKPEENRYRSARTHPSIIPAERYICARTHPPSCLLKKLTTPTVKTESPGDNTQTGCKSEPELGAGYESKLETSDSRTKEIDPSEPMSTAPLIVVKKESPVPDCPTSPDRSEVKSDVFGSVKEDVQLTTSAEGVLPCEAELTDPLETVKCVTCGSGDCDDELLLCDGCDDSHHMFCLDPPLLSLPPGDWRCPKCVAEECNKPQDLFGFEQAEKQYNLRTFGQMANNFKQEYFGKPTHEVPNSTTEKEFWRLVSSIEDEVVVEYGADLHTSRVGSGFPWGKNICLSNADQELYANSPWNLNKLPNFYGSVLKYIDADISGMKVPWAYVGMCFSCFCWHIEDHWSYSINYLHWGEPKTWYGVPSAYAESLEATMKEQAPELFENHADLMHDLVTTLSPTVLMKNGIPVVRTDQCAGEFVVTFPRAYHAGFNQGFNFAEAVNFLLADWISIGRASIDHYSSFSRSPVFCHDELICKMMAQYETLELCLLTSTSKDAAVMVFREEEFRHGLIDKGYVREQRELFEIVKDEDRLCSVCKTYCFLSAVKCSCEHNKMACSKHVDILCDCAVSKKVLKYRYTMPELQGMLTRLGARKDAYVTWVSRVEAILDSTESAKTEVRILKDLLEEANEYGFTESKVCEELLITLQDVKKCVSTALQIGCGKHRTRHSTGKCLDASGLREFLEQVDGLPCLVPEAESLWAKLAEVETFQKEAASVLSLLNEPDYNWTDTPNFNLETLIERGEAFEVHVPEVKELKMALQQTTWIIETESRLNGDKLTLDTLKSMHKLGGTLLHGSVGVEKMLQRVKDMMTSVQEWEQQTKSSLKQKPPQTVEYFTSLLETAASIPVVLPSETTIREALEKAKQWNVQAKAIQESAGNPQYTALKALLDTGHSIPVQLDLMAQLESCYTASKAWYDRTSRAFLKKNSTLGLLEVLLPRSKASFFLRHVNKGPRKKVETDFSHYQDPLGDVVGEREKELAKIHVIEAMEKVYANQIRTENSQKMEQDESGKCAGSVLPALYCFCQKPESGYMLQCELCLEWYHATCLRLPKNKQTQEKEIDKWSRFLCTFCQRTRRPRLDTIVALLISLQKVPVAITEGSALQCLAERAVAWQRKTRQSISSITVTLEAARTQQKRIEEIKGHVCRWRNEAKVDQAGPASSIQAQLASSAGSVLNHYESELERLTVKYAGLGPTRRSSLENLLMEGDLLEVTLDEVQQLWELLQQDNQLLVSFQDKGKAGVDEKPTTVEEQGKARKRGRKEHSPALSTTSTNSVSSDSNKGPPSKKPKRTIRPTPKASPSPTPSGNSRNSLPPTSSALSSETTSVTSASHKTRERSTGSVSSNDGLGCNEEVPHDEEEESECSAEKCKQPVAKEISWVQCDCCQGWFHCMCVGLTKESAEKIESYNCINCKDVKPKPTTSQPASSAKTRTISLPKSGLGSITMESPVALRRGIFELARALQNSIANSKS